MDNFIQYFKDRVWAYRLRRFLRAALAPDKEFLRGAKDRFVAQAVARTGKTAAVHLGENRVARYVAVVFAALLFVNGIAVVYAEHVPLSPRSPLYSYKRAGESIRMGLASPKEKPLLHSMYAKRRVDELKTISAATDPATAAKLDRDIHREIRAAVEETENISGANFRNTGGNASSSTAPGVSENASENTAPGPNPIFSDFSSSTVDMNRAKNKGVDIREDSHEEDSRTTLCEQLSETIREHDAVLERDDQSKVGAKGNFRKFEKLCDGGERDDRNEDD